jgi:hypothetical protein
VEAGIAEGVAAGDCAGGGMVADVEFTAFVVVAFVDFEEDFDDLEDFDDFVCAQADALLPHRRIARMITVAIVKRSAVRKYDR